MSKNKFEMNQLSTFSTSPGVYIMKDKKGTVLYIGKAKNLRQRVKQYFMKGGDEREMIPYLTRQVHTIETIIVHSEKEALLLENNLIKQHQPKYNVFLKDDKTYIALKINSLHPWPRVQLVRYRGQPKKDGQYFGPYTSAHAARETLEMIQKTFPLRQCSDQELLRRTRPCILYDMKRCIAPCVRRCSKEEYEELVHKTTQFLRGNDKTLVKELSKDMQKASDRLDFEKAGEILQMIRSIEKTVEGQHVQKPLGGDADVLGLYRQADEVQVATLEVRKGTLTGASHFSFSHCIQENNELLSTFILQHYRSHQTIPKQIFIPFSISGISEIEEILKEESGRVVSVIAPQKGEKKRLIEMAEENAKSAFQQSHDELEKNDQILAQMQEKFRLTRFPAAIECFDQSNLSGTLPVSALVRFEEGKKQPNGYRKYRIKDAAPSDDYGALKEVLTRRFKRAQDENHLPDLMIVDGGKGHLNIALQVLEELDIASVDLIGVAKESGRHDKGMTAEQVFLPGAKEPIILKSHSPILFLLQRIRDEAHRFAITYQKKRRSKTVTKSALDDIEGIGPKRKQLLLKSFGSLKKIKEATLDELCSIPGISKELAKKIKEI